PYIRREENQPSVAADWSHLGRTAQINRHWFTSSARRRQDIGRIAKRAEEAELRDIIVVHAAKVIVVSACQRLERIDYVKRAFEFQFGVANCDDLAQSLDATGVRHLSVDEFRFSLAQPRRGGLKLGVGADDIAGHQILNPK